MRHENGEIRLKAARQGLTVLLATAFLSQQLGAATPVVLPTNGAYTAGAGNIKSSGNAVTINQSSLRGVIDWNSFSIGQGGAVRFNNGLGATLNRVNGGQLSSILGSLISSGSVYLINPEGVLIGAGARVNTGGDFVASTLNLSNSDFLKGGSLVFKGDSKNIVVNLGDIFSKTGSVLLVGHSVSNSGRLLAEKGTVGLAAGSQVLFKDVTGDQRVFVQGPAGDVTNQGTISAAQAELKAKGGNVYALAGNNGGQIAVTGTTTIGGKVWLVSDGGSTLVTGRVVAKDADKSGGFIETSGHNLNISHAAVSTGQGGNWLLDPVDVLIDGAAASTIQNSLATTNVTVQTTATTASGPGTQTAGNGDITVGSNIAWASANSLALSAFRNIGINNGVTISNSGAGNLTLRSDNSSTGNGTISFAGTGKVDFSGSTGNVALLYNPTSYASPTDYSANVLTNGSWTAPSDGSVSSQMTAYMLVNNAANLENIDANDAGTYAIGRDFDISSISNFTPLGNTSPYFTGILDGGGHSINGLTIADAGGRAGLFGRIGIGGEVRHLNLTNVNITTDSSQVGGVAGRSGGTITDVSVSGTIQTHEYPSTVGGIAGSNYGTIQGSFSAVNIDASIADESPYLGGLVGDNEGPIVNSYSTGAIMAPITSGASVGGLVGYNYAPVSGSSSTSHVTSGGSGETGGLIGVNYSTVTDSYATGSVSAGSSVAGGLIGDNYGGLVSNSHAFGDVSGTADVGGLAGANEAAGTISSSYASGAASGGVRVGGLVGHNDATISQSFASGTVSAGANSQAGGLAGVADSNSSITNSFATGAVSCTTSCYAGGLVGQALSDISVSYATGAVTAGDGSYAGGFAGNSANALTDVYAHGSAHAVGEAGAGGLVGLLEDTGTITNGYASGSVSGLIAGGLVAVNNAYETNITTSYWDSEASGNPSTGVGTGPTGGVTPLTTAQLKSGVMPAGFNTENMVWTAPSGVYPYFGWQGPLVTISGRAYTDAFTGNTPLGSAVVNALSGGALIGTTTTNSNGFYSLLSPQNMTQVGPGVLTYLSAGTANTFKTYQPTGDYSIMDLFNNSLSIIGTASTSLSALTASLAATLGGQTGAAFPFNISNGQLNLVSGTNLRVSNYTGLLTIDRSPIGAAQLLIESGDGLTIAPGQSLTASAGNSMTLYGGSAFTNDAGAGALNVSGGGRFLVYSDSPLNDDRGSVVYDFKQYGAYYGDSQPAQVSGNGFLYALSPVITPTLVGAVTKVYDGTTTAFVNPSNLNPSGVIDGDTVVLAPTAATYTDNKNVGTAKPVTATGIQIASATNGSAIVYGYHLPSHAASGDIGIITQAQLTQTFTPVNKVYDGTSAATVTSGALTGIVTGDAVSLQGGSYNFSDKNAGASKTVTGSSAALAGADSANYSLNLVATGPASITPATLTQAFTPAGKTYDGATTASATAGALTGIIGSDVVSVQGATYNFSDKNAGVNKTVVGSSALLNGADAGNYTLNLVQVGGAAITPATLLYTVGNTASRAYGANNPAFSGAVTGLIGGDTLSSVASGTPAFGSSAGPSSSVGSYAVNGSGLVLTTGNYTLSQSPANSTALTVNPITISIGNVSRASGVANPTFTVNYTGPLSDYLKALFANLKLVTNAPANDAPGVYQITAVVPAALANDITVQPGALTITSANAALNLLVNNSSPQANAVLPASLNYQNPPSPSPLAFATSFGDVDPLIPSNAVSHFQVVITPSPDWTGVSSGGTANYLSSASFTETSPDGHSDRKSSTYAAGAKQP